MIFLVLVSAICADPVYTGNCVSQSIDFTDPTRIFALDGIPSMRNIDELDSGRYDLTIDYNTNLVSFLPDGGISMKINKPENNISPPAPRVSTTRFIRYGRVSMYVKAPILNGVLPDPDLDMSYSDPQGGDEIDWEILGNDPNNVQTNIFYRGLKEFGVRGGKHSLSKPISSIHKYTIDWKHDHINFLIDDVLVRTYSNNSQEAVSRYQNKVFFPNRAMKVQFALWNDPTNAWAGGAIEWPEDITSVTAEYQQLKIECYDDQDNIVPRWPLEDNIKQRPAIRFQPTKGENGDIPKEAGPDFTGEIKFKTAPVANITVPIGEGLVVLPGGTVYQKPAEFRLFQNRASATEALAVMTILALQVILSLL